jgi:hypothetical protein
MSAYRVTLERGYLLHRIDIEKVRTLREREVACSADLGACEQRVWSSRRSRRSGTGGKAGCCSSASGSQRASE